MPTATKRHALKSPRKLKEEHIILPDEVAIERMVPSDVINDMQRMGLVPKRDEIEKWEKLAKSSWPSVAGYNDPLACFIVVRELCKMKTVQQLTAMKLGLRLSGMYPQFIWTTQCIGRILGGLADLAGIEARKMSRQELPYIEKHRVGTGAFYVLWAAPQTYVFLHAVMRALEDEIDKGMERARSGARPVTRDSIWTEIEPDFTQLG